MLVVLPPVPFALPLHQPYYCPGEDPVHPGPHPLQLECEVHQTKYPSLFHQH